MDNDVVTDVDPSSSISTHGAYGALHYRAVADDIEPCKSEVIEPGTNEPCTRDPALESTSGVSGVRVPLL